MKITSETSNKKEEDIYVNKVFINAEGGIFVNRFRIKCTFLQYGMKSNKILCSN